VDLKKVRRNGGDWMGDIRPAGMYTRRTALIMDKATAFGGKAVVPPIKIPTGTFAWFGDLDGNTIGLLKRNG
jgi:hypothetical protein